MVGAPAAPADARWPGKTWSRRQLDSPLAVGAIGGHGPIRYLVEAYTPGQSVRFRLTAPAGFDGWHGFEVLDATPAHCVLEHRIEMKARGSALLFWPLVIGPLHDVCVEDVLSQAQLALGNTPRQTPWPAYVRLLRWLMAGGKRLAPPVSRSEHAR